MGSPKVEMPRSPVDYARGMAIVTNIRAGESIPKSRSRRSGSAALALKFLHEADKCFDRRRLDGVVERHAHAADGTVPRRPDQPGRRGLFAELFFGDLVGMGCRRLTIPSSNTEHHVHQRTRALFNRAMIEAVARVDGIIEQLGLGLVALLYSTHPALRFNPLHHEANHVHRECWRCVVKRLLFDMRAVLKDRWQVLVCSLGKVFANEYDRDARRTEVLLCTGENQSEL